MKKLKLLLLVSSCLILNNAIAGEESTYCTDYKVEAKKGDQAYLKKDYPLAIREYRNAIFSVELCIYHNDKKDKQYNLWASDENTIYNSMALAYLKNNEPLKAEQYLSIANQGDKKTVFNRSLVQKTLNKVEKEDSIKGNYWQYAGMGMWKSISVTPNDKLWDVDVHAIRPMYNWGGANLGELQATLSLVDNKIRYEAKEDYLDCDITFTFSENALHAETGNSECGFGHGVYVNGDFSRVEYDEFYDVLDFQDDQLESFIPKGWKLIAKAEGDLNKDGISDVALIIEATDKSRMIKNDALGAPILNVNPRHLLVLVKQENDTYFVVKQNTNFIPSENDEESPCLEDPLSTTDFKIHNGSLEILLHYWLSCGSYGVNNDTYTFRLENKDLRLIGFDHDSLSRSSPNNSQSISVNLLTNKRKSVISKYFGDDEPEQNTVKWTIISLKNPVYIDDINKKGNKLDEAFYKDAY